MKPSIGRETHLVGIICLLSSILCLSRIRGSSHGHAMFVRKSSVRCRPHQSSVIHSAASAIATALPFSPSQPSSPQPDTPRFATLGSLGHSNQQKPSNSLSHAFERSSRLLESSFQSPAVAMESPYSRLQPSSLQQYPANSMSSSFHLPAETQRASHARSDTQASLHLQSRLRDSTYPQDVLARSPSQREPASSPRHGAFAGSSPCRVASNSPCRSPAHAAAVSAVEQELHASLHEEPALLTSRQGRAIPNSPSPRPDYQHSQVHSHHRRDEADAYQRWKGHSSHVGTSQHSGQQMHAVPDNLPYQSQLSQRPHDSDLLPLNQHLPYASPELDSLSQRLRHQKLTTDRQGHTGFSPLQGRAASYSPGKAYAAHSHGMPGAGLRLMHDYNARPDPSPFR